MNAYLIITFPDTYVENENFFGVMFSAQAQGSIDINTFAMQITILRPLSCDSNEF